jgi:hypothetical protein
VLEGVNGRTFTIGKTQVTRTTPGVFPLSFGFLLSCCVEDGMKQTDEMKDEQQKCQRRSYKLVK